VVLIRPAGPQDAAGIAEVRATSWRAAYRGIIPDSVLAQATGPDTVRLNAESIRAGRWRLITVAEDGEPGGRDKRVVGFASSGPERLPGAQLFSGQAREPGQASLASPAAAPAPSASAPSAAELYAIYVLPEVWSAGIGRSLLARAVDWARRERYDTISLWVLEGNARARRFYERAGFAATGDTQVLDRLGGVAEVRYRLPLRADG
jgi:GNAT superfamily N-acetyltransferase